MDELVKGPKIGRLGHVVCLFFVFFCGGSSKWLSGFVCVNLDSFCVRSVDLLRGLVLSDNCD